MTPSASALDIAEAVKTGRTTARAVV